MWLDEMESGINNVSGVGDRALWQGWKVVLGRLAELEIGLCGSDGGRDVWWNIFE